MTFWFQNLDIPEIIFVRCEVLQDERGYFLETYKYSRFRSHGIPDRFVQDNYSYSKRGVIRGLHFQIPPQPQGKLVSVRRGEVYDIAVDIRVGSPTYGEWVSKRLSAENHDMLYIPVGFAHGYQVVSQGAEVAYKVTSEYNPELSFGIAWDDPALDIPWPIDDPILSLSDIHWPTLSDSQNYFNYE